MTNAEPIVSPTDIWTRKLLSIVRHKNKPWEKMMAVHKIKMQPFFGEVFPKNQSDKLTIRRKHANTP